MPMNESATSFPTSVRAASTSAALARQCPRCAGSMVPFATTSNSGGTVGLDYCRTCRSVWFDAKESVQLSGLGWVALLRLLATSGEAATDFGQKAFACPRCRMTLNAMHNQTRTGRFVLYRCTGCGGHFQTQVGLLSQ